MAMTDAHRLLVQTFISKPVIPDADLNTSFQQIANLYNNRAALEPFIATINDNLRYVSMEIRKTIWEEDGELYWGLVNVRGDDHVKTATSYNASELALFKKIMEQIIAGGGIVAGTEANNLARTLEPPIPLTRADGIIDRFVADQWLARTTDRDGERDSNATKFLTLGVRSMLELRPYLDSLYAEISASSSSNAPATALPDCIMCSEPVLRGEVCANSRCPARMHRHCAQKWFQGKRDPRCPHCSTAWTTYHSIS
jgi:hypothetical protein